MIVPPHIKLYVLPSEQLQTPWVCDGLPVHPGSGLSAQPHVPPAHADTQRRPVEQLIGMYPLKQIQVLPDPQVVLGGQVNPLQLVGFDPHPAGTDITHGYVESGT